MIPKLASIHCHHDRVRSVEVDVKPCPGSNEPDAVEIRIQIGSSSIYLEMSRHHAEQISRDISSHFMGVDHDADEKAVQNV